MAVDLSRYQVKAGDVLTEGKWNDLVSLFGQMLNAWTGGGDVDVIQNSSGIFLSIPKRSIIREGFLNEDLDASTDDGETETTAELAIWEGKGANWRDTGRTLTVTNRDDNFSASEGDRLTVQMVGSGEYRPQAAGGCESQNEIWTITLIGLPTGGTASLWLTLNGVEEEITLNYNDTASDVQTALNGHSEASSSTDFEVTAGPFPNRGVVVEFQGQFENVAIKPATIEWGSLTGGSGVGAFVQINQRGR